MKTAIILFILVIGLMGCNKWVEQNRELVERIKENQKSYHQREYKCDKPCCHVNYNKFCEDCKQDREDNPQKYF